MHPLAHSALIGCAVVSAIAATFALGRGPQHQLRDKPFDRTLHEDIAAMAAASERIESLNKPRLVQTESILPVERDPLMMALSENKIEKNIPNNIPAARKALVSNDICTRHGRVKVWVSKYRWRCLK